MFSVTNYLYSWCSQLPNTADCVFGAPIINNSSSSPISVVSPATEPM